MCDDLVDEKLSNFYVSLEIAQVYNGMMIAIPADEWSIFQNLTVAKMASVLKQLAAKVSLEKFQKSKRVPNPNASLPATDNTSPQQNYSPEEATNSHLQRADLLG